MATDGPAVPTDRRAMLAAKGRTLYGKYCGTGGRGICAESFAVYHLGRGESFVAADLLAYLECRAAESGDPGTEVHHAMTVGLIARVRAHLSVGAES